MKTVQITQGKQRPFLFQATGVNGGDVSSKFDGRVLYSSADPSIVGVLADASTLGGKLQAPGVTGTAVVNATGTLADGRQFTVEVEVTVVAPAPPPDEDVASVDLQIGDEEPIST